MANQSLTTHDHNLSACRKILFASLTLSIMIIITYSNTFHSSWHFDDLPNISENANLHMSTFSLNDFKNAIFSDIKRPWFPYRPVACLSFALNYYFGGLNVFGYHVVNIFIHILSSVFLFLLVYRTLNLPSLKENYGPNAYSIALLATVFWALNPIHTQAITYIVQRMASLAAMFYVAGMYFYSLFRTSESRATRYLSGIMIPVCFLLALGTKENAAMFPISLFLYEVILIQADPAEFLRKNLWKLLVALLVTLAIGVIYLYAKGGSIFFFLKGYDNRPFNLSQRLLTEARILIFYVTLLSYPMPGRLSLVHEFPLSNSVLNPISTLLSIIAILGSVTLSLVFAKKLRIISFALLFFVLNHLIESTIFPLELIFEHRNYLPSMFLFVPAAAGLVFLINFYSNRRFMRNVIAGFVCLVIIGLGHSSYIRNVVWKNEHTLWLDAVDKAPNVFRPHHNLAKYYQTTGNEDLAIKEYQEALSKPATNSRLEKFITYYNLGKLYADRKEYEKALEYYEKSISINPRFADTYNNMGVLMETLKRPDEAEKLLKRAYSLNPFQPEINFNLGLYYLRKNQPGKAIPFLERARKSAAIEPAALANIGVAYKLEQRLSAASRYFLLALRKNPGDPITRLHLATLLWKKGQYEKAISLTQKVALTYRDPEALKHFLKKITDQYNKFTMPKTQLVFTLLKKAYARTAREYQDCLNLLEEYKGQKQ